jgi:hypothetical protein
VTRQIPLLVSIAGFLVLLAGCSDAPDIVFRPANRVVLAEFFTFSRCSYCPYAARALDSVARESDDSLVVIADHRREDGDTLSPTCVEDRANLYQESGGGEPATSFDGGPVVRTADPGDDYPTFHAQFLAAHSIDPYAVLTVSGNITASVCSVTVRAAGVDSTPAESLRVFIVICEDSVRNHLVGNADTIFNHVMRAMLPDENGTAVVLTRDDTVNVTQTVEVAPFWNPAQLRAVAFVQEMSTLRVLQAACCQLVTQEGP